jgi:Trk K+ transport system NAD-binding subunit
VLDDDRRVVGTLSISDIVRAYRQELAGSAERVGGLGAKTGISLVTIRNDSPMSGKTLRQAGLPKGLVITSVTRGDRVFVPNGDTELTEGDQLSVLGQTGDLEDIGQVEPLGRPSHLNNGSSPPPEH